jgi:hypothetical protein
MKIEITLKTLREFQEKYPLSHVGGSIGIMMHGIDLKRDLSKSDLDITNPHKMPEMIFDNCFESSEPSDFDHRLVINVNENYYTKVEIRVNPEPSFEVLRFEGHNYNVSLLNNIIFWKQKYADKGYQKHIDDLIVINGGERPKPLIPTLSKQPFVDDLPF